MAATEKKWCGTPRSAPWQKRRPPNGYSYLEVFRELKRRKKGDYLLSSEVRNDVFEAGVHRLSAQYFISSILSGIMKEYELTSEEFLSLFSCRNEDSADTLLSCILSPYQRSKDADISNNAEVDELFQAQGLKRT